MDGCSHALDGQMTCSRRLVVVAVSFCSQTALPKMEIPELHLARDMKLSAILLLQASSALCLSLSRADLVRGCAATAAGLTTSSCARADDVVPPKKVIYRPPSVKEPSNDDQIALAKHLQKQGAKMYGAYVRAKYRA